MVKMSYAYDQNREIVHVDQVPGGKACNCRCIECNEPVEAHQGHIRAHYFAHCAVSTCPGPSAEKLLKVTTVPESQIHAAAKKIITHNSSITVPTVSCNLSPLMNHPIPLAPPEKQDYKDAKTEYNAGDYRPDVRIDTAYGKTDVEICVEHSVDDAKIQKVRKAGVRMMEITLTDLADKNKGKDSGIPYKDLRELVLHDFSRRHWINHPYSDRIQNQILSETLLSGNTLYSSTHRYCPCNYDKDGRRNTRNQNCSTCKFHHVDQVSGKEYCSTYSSWINILPAYSLSIILSEKVCPYCGAPIQVRSCKKTGKGSFICCSDSWGKCRFRLDYDKTKAKLAAAHLSMPDYLVKA